MDQWEYRTIEVADWRRDVSSTMAQAGKEGWELVAVTPITGAKFNRAEGHSDIPPGWTPITIALLLTFKRRAVNVSVV